MNEQRARRLAAIIIKVSLGTANAAERQSLLEWLDEAEENRQTYVRIINGATLRERIAAEQRAGTDAAFERVRAAVVAKLMRGRRLRLRRRAVTAVAVSACAALLLFAVLSSPYGARVTGDEQHGPKVELILASGEVIDISGRTEAMDELIESYTRQFADTALSGGSSHAAGPSAYTHKIVTHNETQSSFRLSDGTTVWLNAASEFEFPAFFSDNNRTVRLSGEAYFDVTHDEQAPFLVETQYGTVRVLGTAFNVQAYRNEDNFTTTLCHGRVEVSSAGSTLELTPGQQSVLDKQSGHLYARVVDTDDITAWRDGVFIFNEKPIENVFRTLARWYDMDFYTNPDRVDSTYTFTGSIRKGQDLATILEMITLAGGPEFAVDGRLVVVK